MTDPNAPQPRPDEEPRSRPFEPVAYNLEPQFSTPPVDPAQPVLPTSSMPSIPVSGAYPQHQQHPAAPSYQQPYQQPVYQQPVYQQPAYPPPSPPPAYAAPPPIMPPPAPRRRRRGWAIGLSIAGAVLLVCGVISCVVGYPYISEYGATISLPSELPGGLAKDTSSQQQQIADQVKAQIRSEVNPDQVEAAFYAVSNAPSREVLLVAATALLINPSGEVNSAFQGLRGDVVIQNARDYPAGSLGGVVRCGDGAMSNIDVAFCVWADHGSIGVGIFFDSKSDDSAPLFVQIREQVVRR